MLPWNGRPDTVPWPVCRLQAASSTCNAPRHCNVGRLSPRTSSVYAAARASKAARMASFSCRSYSSRPSSAAWGKAYLYRHHSPHSRQCSYTTPSYSFCTPTKAVPAKCTHTHTSTWCARVTALWSRVQPDAALPPAVQVAAHGVKHFGRALCRHIGGCRAHIAARQGGRRVEGV